MRTGRVVIVTGAAGGIGHEVVRRFLDNGDTVIATDIHAAGLRDLADRHAGKPLITRTADLTDPAGCAAVADDARRRAGRVDVLINVAGYFPITAFEEMTLDAWQRVLAVNLTGPFLMIKAILSLMTGSGWGKIVLFRSASIFEGVETQVHYTAAKAGVVGMARSLAPALGGYGITINVVAPGLTSTPPVVDTFPPEFIASQHAMRSIRRDETAEDLVGPTFFLASPDSDFMSGQTLTVDGGKHKA